MDVKVVFFYRHEDYQGVLGKCSPMYRVPDLKKLGNPCSKGPGH